MCIIRDSSAMCLASSASSSELISSVFFCWRSFSASSISSSSSTLLCKESRSFKKKATIQHKNDLIRRARSTPWTYWEDNRSKVCLKLMGEDRLCKSSWPCPCMHACIYMNKMYISYSCKTTDHRAFSHGLITHQSIWHNTLVTTSLAMIIATIYCNHHTLVMRSSLLSIQYLSSSSIFITLMETDSSVFEPMIVDTVPLPSNSSSGTSSSSNKSKQF